eukprot:TRINITY_DN16991_c0_g1_i1.p1 TRINITY_DN16991_c0_g1~~TRINITY_DN16991_c0_g1_i1.p1  ORF type:complete len:174 (+),score=25.89 TRINITY_DN16991_c0_g1_i1:56-577(+)
MEILDKNAGLICDFEVLEVISKHYDTTDKKEKKRLQRDKDLNSILWIKERIQIHFQNTPASQITSEIAQRLVDQFAPYHFTNAEILQIINNRPTELVHIHSIIEQFEERLTPQQAEDVLAIIRETLPAARAQAPAESQPEIELQIKQASKKVLIQQDEIEDFDISAAGAGAEN